MRRIALIVVAAASAVLAGRAHAIVGGDTPSPAPSWTARITINGGGLCSGALISSRWVLTAAHCVHEHETGRILRGASFVVQIGVGVEDRGFIVGVDRPAVSRRINVTADHKALQDIALLHLSRPAPPSLAPLPLRFSPDAVPTGSAVRFFGWGATGFNVGHKLYATRAGEWTLSDTCFAHGQACYVRAPGAFSFPAAGDSGSPVVARVHGGFVDVGVFTGPGPKRNGGIPEQYGASILAYLSWIRATTGLPAVHANQIVRDSASGSSWLVEGDGFRHQIPTAADYSCFTAEGMSVESLTPSNLASIPEDHDASATCTPPPPPALTATANGSQLSVQLSNVPLGVATYTCFAGSGYPTAGAATGGGQIAVTAAALALPAVCSGSGSAWLGLHAADGHDYYSNVVTLVADMTTPSPA